MEQFDDQNLQFTIVTTSHPEKIHDIEKRSKLWSYRTVITASESMELKSQAYRQLLNSPAFHKGDGLVLVCDSIDTLFNYWTLEDINRVFHSYNAGIVLSVENNCWPYNYCGREGIANYNNSASNDFYPNAGVYIGTVNAVRLLQRWISTQLTVTMNDQEKIHRFYLHHRHAIMENGKLVVALDIERNLFYNLNDESVVVIPHPIHASKPYTFTDGCFVYGTLRPHATIKCNAVHHECYIRETDCSELWFLRGDNRTNKHCSLIRRTSRPAGYDPLVIHGNSGTGKNVIQKLQNKLYKTESCTRT